MVKEEFLHELKLHYEKEFERKNTLESKGNYLVTVNGIVIPIIFTLAVFLIEKIDVNYSFFESIKIMLILMLILNLSSIYLSVIGYAVRNYRYSFRGENFNLSNGEIDEGEIKEYYKFTADEFLEKMIKVYIKCNRDNRKQNDFKAISILFAQIIFSVSFIFVPIILGLLFYFPPFLNN